MQSGSVRRVRFDGAGGRTACKGIGGQGMLCALGCDENMQQVVVSDVFGIGDT